MTSSTDQTHRGAQECDEPAERAPAASLEQAPAQSGDAKMRAVKEKLMARVDDGEREKEARKRITLAVLRATYGEGGAACHAMTNGALDCLIDEMRSAAAEGVVGAQESLWALEDARQKVGTAYSEWTNYCRMK